MMNTAWQPIENLPAGWRDLSVSGLSDFARIWNEQKERLTTSESLKRFNERLRREWAIETGIIENLYSIDRGTTQLLIEKGLDASLIPHGATDKPADEVITLVRDQEEAYEGLFDFVKNRRNLSTSYIKELHQLLTRNQPTTRAIDPEGRYVEVSLRRGDWKILPNNPTRPDATVHPYCPPEHVAAEMDALISMHLSHSDQDVPPEVEAAWLHHRFVQIHPFQDGNGRVARTLSSLVLLRAGWFPLVITRDNRAAYIDALEKADAEDLGPLVQLFGSLQKKALLKALSLSENVLREAEPLAQLLEAVQDRMRDRRTRNQERHKLVFSIAGALEEYTFEELDHVAKPIDETVKRFDSHFFATAQRSTAERQHWFRYQVVDTARQLDYYADTRTYQAWTRLRIKEEQQAQLVVSIHSLGVEFLGVLAVSAFMDFRDKGEDGETTIEGPIAVCKEPFQFAYTENKDEVLSRFSVWLNDIILVGLDEWRRRL